MGKKFNTPYMYLEYPADSDINVNARHLINNKFPITAACVVPCGGRKRSPSTSSIVQNIFSFWSFEISEGILRI